MKRNISKFMIFFLTLSLLQGCGGNAFTDEGTGDTSQTGTSQEITANYTDEEMFTERDSKMDYDETEAITIQLNGDSATASDTSVEISGTTITITEEATYIVSGDLADGMLMVDAPDTAKLQIVLKDADITSSTSAPLYIKEADKVFITLVGENVLSSEESYEAIDENNIDGTVFSKQDLTFNGNGALTINSPTGHGIVAKDDLVFTGGTYAITSASQGIQANDSVRIKDVSISVDAGKDGIHVENTEDTEKGFVYISSGNLEIESEGDGISASSYIQILDGQFTILAGGGYENSTKEHSDNFGNFGGMPGGYPGNGGSGMGRPGGGRTSQGNENEDQEKDKDSLEDISADEESSSMKGLKSGNSMVISGGSFTIDSADDALHSNLSMTINGGTFEIASGDDALHAEENLAISGGDITITNSYEGLEALHIFVSGGTISIQATDDGLNAAGGTDASGTTGGRDGMMGGPGGMGGNSNGSITISGGEIFLYAQGDGLDANGTIEIIGGKTIVTGPTSGDTAILDYDNTATITGGSFIGVGSTMMAQIFSDGTQGTLGVKASGNGGTTIRIEDTSGTEILNFTPETAYACIIISTPDLVQGETYTMYVGDASGEIEAQ